MSEELKLLVQEEQPAARMVSHPRSGWTDAFQRMAAAGDDGLLDGESLVASDWDKTEWEW